MVRRLPTDLRSCCPVRAGGRWCSTRRHCLTILGILATTLAALTLLIHDHHSYSARGKEYFRQSRRTIDLHSDHRQLVASNVSKVSTQPATISTMTSPAGQSLHYDVITPKLHRDGNTLSELHHHGSTTPSSRSNSNGVIHVVVVACGSHTERATVALKSAVMMSRTRLHLHAFSDSEKTRQEISTELAGWPDVKSGRVTHSTHNLLYPAGEDVAAWKFLFRQCATVRLFLADILAGVDSILYVDSDVLFFSPVEGIWSLLHHFNTSQLASMTPEHEEKSIGWYNRHGKHPYVGKTGLNSGVMLMNLTRMRTFRFADGKGSSLTWSQAIVKVYHEYRNVITWGDQDILNIFFHFNPAQLYIHECEWNYRPDHCMYRPFAGCPAAERNSTIRLLHLNRNAAVTPRWGLGFGAVYSVFISHGGVSILPGNQNLVSALKKKLSVVQETKGCGTINSVLIAALANGISQIR
eukprot:scpid56644/ scgid31004/ Glucoside xylosyltransferase 2; Glycosyltransferase 8 domain-containing protein 4